MKTSVKVLFCFRLLFCSPLLFQLVILFQMPLLFFPSHQIFLLFSCGNTIFFLHFGTFLLDSSTNPGPFLARVLLTVAAFLLQKPSITSAILSDEMIPFTENAASSSTKNLTTPKPLSCFIFSRLSLFVLKSSHAVNISVWQWKRENK